MPVGRYVHAKQFRCMCKALKKMKGYSSKGMRGQRRHVDDIPTGPLRDQIVAKPAGVLRRRWQQPKRRNKI